MVAKATRYRKTLLGVVPIESPLYALHPVTRLIALVVLAVAPLFIDLPEVNFLYLLGLAALFWVARVNVSQLKVYLPLIVSVAFFMFVVSILAPDRSPSDLPLRVFGITLYYQPLRWTFASYLRILAMLFATILYFSSNPERDLLVALRTLRVPFPVSYVVSLSVRSAALFTQDLQIIREAQQARGLDDSLLSIRDRLRMYGLYLIPLFTISIRRAEEISNALFARGYTPSGRCLGGGKRSDFIRSLYPFHTYDAVAIALLIAFFVIIASLQIVDGAFRIDHTVLNRLVEGTY